MPLASVRFARRLVSWAGLASFSVLSVLGGSALTGCSSDTGPGPTASIDAATASTDAAASDSGSGDAALCKAGAGPILAEAGVDDHCEGAAGPIRQSATACVASADEVDDPDAALPADDAGTPDEYVPPPHEGTEAEDDDCKYHVAFQVSCVQIGQEATFTMTVTSRVDGSPVTGAKPHIEGTLNDVRPLPNSPKQITTEVGGGVYTVGPVPFDAPGVWDVRFHFFESCVDSIDSKHSHVGFKINVL